MTEENTSNPTWLMRLGLAETAQARLVAERLQQIKCGGSFPMKENYAELELTTGSSTQLHSSSPSAEGKKSSRIRQRSGLSPAL